jgi:hypothetical protein
MQNEWSDKKGPIPSKLNRFKVKKTVAMKRVIPDLKITIPTQKVQGPLTPRPVPATYSHTQYRF